MVGLLCYACIVISVVFVYIVECESTLFACGAFGLPVIQELLFLSEGRLEECLFLDGVRVSLCLAIKQRIR